MKSSKTKIWVKCYLVSQVADVFIQNFVFIPQHLAILLHRFCILRSVSQTVTHVFSSDRIPCWVRTGFVVQNSQTVSQTKTDKNNYSCGFRMIFFCLIFLVFFLIHVDSESHAWFVQDICVKIPQIFPSQSNCCYTYSLNGARVIWRMVTCRT